MRLSNKRFHQSRGPPVVILGATQQHRLIQPHKAQCNEVNQLKTGCISDFRVLLTMHLAFRQYRYLHNVQLFHLYL